MRGVSVAWLLWILFFGAWLLVAHRRMAGADAFEHHRRRRSGPWRSFVVGVEVASLVSIARTRAAARNAGAVHAGDGGETSAAPGHEVQRGGGVSTPRAISGTWARSVPRVVFVVHLVVKAGRFRCVRRC